MITIDAARCNDCGICLRHLDGYCLRRQSNAIAIDYAVCRGCLKCVAICPHQAFLVDGKAPRRISDGPGISAEALAEFMQSRRSIKAFKDVPLRRETLEAIVRSGGWAPTTNRDIEAIVVDDRRLIELIDAEALHQVRKWRTLLFGFRPFTWLASKFSRDLAVIERKMSRDLDVKKRVTKPGTQALVVLIGDPRVPVTASSAQYYLSNMIFMAHVHGVGSCLMDSLRLSIERSRAARAALDIPRRLRVLGVLCVGLPDEKIVNIPLGLELNIGWNVRRRERVHEGTLSR